MHCTLDLELKLHTLLDFFFLECFIYIYIYIKLIKIKEKQQVGIKVPKFLADAFLKGLFLTTE